MRAYLIDPFTKTVSLIDYDGKLDSIYKLVGCSTVEALTINPAGDAVYIDEEGLFVEPEKQEFFVIDTHPQPIAGRALVVGSDDMGDDLEPVEAIESVRARVGWIVQLRGDIMVSASDFNGLVR